MTLQIRDLAAADEAAWRELWAAYLVFYEQDLGPEITNSTWARLVDPSNSYWCLVAEEGGQLLGFAINLTLQSTWSVEDVVYLEDLYVAEGTRGKGVGRALIDASVARVRDAGHRAYFWQTHDDNRAARMLYDKLTGGATNWVKYEYPL